MKYGALISECDPMQNHWEMNEVLTFLERYDIETVLEIGMYQGGTFACWSRALRPSHLIGVTRDRVELVPPPPQFADRLRQRGGTRGSSDFGLRRLVDRQPRVDLIYGLSQDAEVHAQAVAALDGDPVDFLFIDGGHHYDEVSRDFDLYSPLVREGGVVGIHDVNRGAVDVNRYWEDVIRYQNRTVLMSAPLVGAGGLGIGLVLL